MKKIQRRKTMIGYYFKSTCYKNELFTSVTLYLKKRLELSIMLLFYTHISSSCNTYMRILTISLSCIVYLYIYKKISFTVVSHRLEDFYRK